MKIEICDKCGKRIKGNVNTLIYKSFIKTTNKLDFCDECFDEIISYKKDLIKKGILR